MRIMGNSIPHGKIKRQRQTETSIDRQRPTNTDRDRQRQARNERNKHEEKSDREIQSTKWEGGKPPTKDATWGKGTKKPMKEIQFFYSTTTTTISWGADPAYSRLGFDPARETSPIGGIFVSSRTVHPNPSVPALFRQDTTYSWNSAIRDTTQAQGFSRTTMMKLTNRLRGFNTCWMWQCRKAIESGMWF